MASVQRMNRGFSLAFSWQDIGLMAILLVILNAVDVASTVYAINVLGFAELNPLAEGLFVWFSFLKIAICFIPMACAYVLEKLEMKDYLFLPFAFSTILILYYALVVAFNIQTIIAP